MKGVNIQNPSGQRPLRPRARLLRTLGSDLISSEKVALIELVKNSYDADATVVLIEFQETLERGDGRLAVWDDGHGMDAETLQESWLDIASDSKKKRPRSENGRRRVLGEKGIGRLAAARLGSEMLLVTRRAEEDEVQFLIDWNAFDREDAYLDEIDIVWQSGQPSVFAADGRATSVFEDASLESWCQGQGTLLQIDKLSRAWSDDDFRELRTALSRLIRPKPNNANDHAMDDFRIVLKLPAEHEHLTGEVAAPEELNSPHYRLHGTVSNTGSAQLRYSQLDPSIDEVWEDVDIWGGEQRSPSAGPFDLDIQVWDRDKAAIGKVPGSPSVQGFRRLLDQVAGVSIYRDGFRVLPFGELGDDWLGLDRRRVQNPTLRVSNNQVIGHIFIGADTNIDLRDQTNREGLLEGTAYEDLQAMMRNVLALVERKRYVARRKDDPRRKSSGGLFSSFDLREIRGAVAASYPNDLRLLSLVDAKTSDMQAGVDEVQRVLSQYSRLVTLGSLIDRVLHDGRTSVSRLKNVVRFGRRDLEKRSLSPEEKIAASSAALDNTSVQAELLASLFNQIEPFGGRKRGRPKTEALRGIIDDAVAIFSAEVEEIGAEIEVVGDGIDVRVDRSEILTVLVNLLQNSLHWLRTVPLGGGRKILVAIARNEDGSVSIIVSDSGPGVPEELREAIFDPYFSDRHNGVGLGLSIAGNIIQDLYGGGLALVEQGSLCGATFEATLRKRV